MIVNFVTGNIKHLWKDDSGREWDLAKASFSYSRFNFLLRNICFDDLNKREKMIKEDKFSLFREIFKIVNNRFSKYYEPSEFLVIDEQLIKFSGRVSFRQFIKSKPARYGLKIYALIDNESMYTCNLEPYV